MISVYMYRGILFIGVPNLENECVNFNETLDVIAIKYKLKELHADW